MQFRSINISPTTPALLALLAGSLVSCLGCGKGEYDARLDGVPGLMAKRASSVPSVLTQDFFPVTDPARAPIGYKFKLPTLFSGPEVKSFGAETPRAKLMNADLLGFCYTMERPLADDGGKNIPAYCYLFVVNKTTASPDELHTQIQTAAAPLDSSASWTDVPTIPVIAGGAPAKMLRVTGNFDFEINGAAENLPGQIEVYSLDAGANQVLVGWRAATSTATKHQFFEAVKASMATVQADAPARD